MNIPDLKKMRRKRKDYEKNKQLNLNKVIFLENNLWVVNRDEKELKSSLRNVKSLPESRIFLTSEIITLSVLHNLWSICN